MYRSGKTDQLSDVFATLRLRSDLYFRADLAGEFAIAVPPERRLIRFHFVRRGRCFVGTEEEDAAWEAVSEGDLAIVPNGATHVIADDPGRVAKSLADVIATGALGPEGVLNFGDGPGNVQLLCGYCGFDEDIAHPVLSHLPSSIILRSGDIGHEPWVQASLRLLSLETELADQGMNGVLSRVLEILLIQSVRNATVSHRRDSGGYMAALADPHLSKALLAIHRSPDHPWTITELARVSAMSRARFADRFTDMVGVPPISYLTNWRLMKARRMLRETKLGIDEIALRCGYASLASFTRRYSKAFGIGPGAYRRAESLR